MKKIMLLGGSAQQVVAIETAKRLGFYTILCDYLIDNPGQYAADHFYLLSTTDSEKVLRVAEEQCIDGIIAYASDPAAPTAAYVAEKLKLPTNPFHAVDILCNKDKFRNFLVDNGFNAPLAGGYTDKKKAIKEVDNFHLPVIIKPADSSGSKGTSVIHKLNELEKSIEFAFSVSKKGKIVIEEFIDKRHDFLVGGDIFIIDGKIVLWGLMNCHRDNAVNSLVPVGKSYPLFLDNKAQYLVKETLQKIVDKLGIINGAMNVELVVDSCNRVYPIDIGPRSGGNMIPELLGYIFGIDVVEMSIRAAMGLVLSYDNPEGTPFYSTHNLHSANNGVFQEIIFSKDLEKYIFRKCLYKRQGDAVEYFDNASKALGIIFMKFTSMEEMLEIFSHITDYYTVKLR